MPEANPETGVSNEESAVAHVAGLLESDGPTEEKDDQPPANQEEELAEEEASSKEEDQAESEGESEELPDTIEGFAEALGVDPGDLLGHVKVPVTVDGKVSHVTLAEAAKGHQRESDYLKKTEELANQRKAIEASNQQAVQRWQEKLERVDQVLETAEALLDHGPSEDDLYRLMEEDPASYMREKAKKDRLESEVEKAQEERDRLKQEAQKEQHQRLAAFRQAQQAELRNKLPEASDPEKMQKFERDVSSYLKTMGYGDEEISAVFGGPYDHRNILIVRDAMRFRALQSGKPAKKLKDLPKPLKPGSPERKADRDKLLASRNRLKQLKGKASKSTQTKAAVEFVKNLL